MTSLKIRTIGNSQGVVLPKALLERFKLAAGDVLYVTEASDGSMRITPYDPAFSEQLEAAKEGMAAYRNALRELAR
ncbi:transcriptional regulator [Maricaulis sp. W15]|uniref:AbrB/MazE/SpoVT family DNA-binding domain-containing protein n=1 Tax=Maricaulis sp. W15 TaxID=1772333 RepID=UPI000948BF75|nr:AbrB/MazE/SpoVT family DNA-binding domain-containing protein [Maricaulis sp. W15]OLF72298.1 transcriptional regulator [Maricaulis sp. W15]